MTEYKTFTVLVLAGILTAVPFFTDVAAEAKIRGKQQELFNLIESARSTKNMHRTPPATVKILKKIKRLLALPISGNRVVDIEGKNEKSETALVIAVKRNNNEIAHMLLEHGADPNARNSDGTPILLTATRFLCTDIALNLIKAKPDPDLRDKNGRTALTNLVANGCREHVDLFLENGADVNFPRTINSVKADTALHLAQDYVVLNILGERGADVNRQEAVNGFTPLHYAVLRNNFLKVEYLIENGANPSIRDNDGKTPLEYARQYSDRKSDCGWQSCWQKLYMKYNEDSFHLNRTKNFEPFTNDRIIKLLEERGR